MMIFGHLAISALLHHYLDADLGPAVAGGIAPDVVDKTLCHVLRLLPNGRMYAHTLLGLGVSTAAVDLIWGRRTARSWALGYLGHLVGDLHAVPWLYPLVQSDFARPSPGLWQVFRGAVSNPLLIAGELGLVAWAIYALGSALVCQDETTCSCQVPCSVEE